MPPKSIFIVEDEIITARSIARNIQKFGYQVAGIATSGSEAIAEIMTTKPDLVLMDILLQKNDVDGITTAERVQSQLNVPIIYLTAHSDSVTLERAKFTTPFGYILKPYNKKDLQISIELALHKHQQEIQLIKREELLTSILNATQDGVVATDTNSKIIYMNPAAENSTGWQLDQIGDRTARDILRIIDGRTQEIWHPLDLVLAQGEVLYLSESVILLRKTGESRQIRNSISPIFDTNGEITGAVLIFTDLSNISADRTNQMGIISNPQVNQLGNYLIDLIVHELRTPLTVILSTAKSLQSYRQKWTIAKQDESLSRIQQAVEQMTRLLNNVAIWDELGAEQIDLMPEWFNILTLSQEIITELESIDGGKHQLTLSSRGARKLVFLDRDILRYILVNLLLNGLKYSPQETVVSLSLEFKAESLTIQVSDHGIGIPLEEQQRIFEPLYRAGNIDQIKGTGLGLAIVKAYVQLCGGEISLTSSTLFGTVFTVNLPLREFAD